MKTLLATVLGLLVVSSAASGDTCAPSTFARGVPLDTEYSAQGITVGDLDGNGFDDLIVTTSADVVVTYLSAGDGTFGPATHSPSASTSYPHVATGYWDAGGDLDVAYPIYDSVVVELGAGDGTFQGPVFYPGLPNPTGFGAADLTGDGKVDLVVAGAQTIMVLPGNGNGTFAAPLTYGTGLNPQGLAVGDFDDDGNVDAAVTLDGGVVSIYLGNGAGGLAPPSTIKVGATLSWIVAADLNHDGKLDLGMSAGFYAAVLRGNGDGTFRAAIEYPSGFELGQLAAADLDGDGWTDLVALRRPPYYNGAGIVVPMLQQANGSLKLHPAFVAGSGSLAIAVAQIDGDSLADVLTADSASATVSVLYSQGGGRFRAPVYAPLQTLAQVLADGDFDEDGRPDLVAMAANYDGPLQIVHVVDGAVTADPVIDLDQTPQGLAAADFNRDGHLDLAVTTYYGGLRMLLGNGDGTFQPPIAYQTGWGARAIAAGDFDGNGYPDVALNDLSNSTSQPEIAVFLNDGTGTGGLLPGTPIPTGHQIGALVAASLDAGPTLDLAATNGDCCGPEFDTVLVMHGNGDGTFSSPVEFAAGPAPTALVAADFDGDDAADLAVADAGGNTVAMLLRDGAGGFQAPILVAVGATPLGLTAADFDIDGKTDLMTSNPNTSTASLLLGTGDAGFQAPVFYPAPGGTAAIRAVNFGGKGADVVIGSGNDVAIEILQNTHLSVQTLYAHTALLGGRATFAAAASGFGPLSYQWLENGTPLTDGGAIAGALTPTLTIEPVSFADLGAYSVKVTDSCGTTTSNAVSLYVEFADVPSSSPFHDDIIAIAAAGITGGCGGANYCPTSPVRRDQMAAFLLRAQHGAAYTPPACAGVFADVPCPSAFADWIEQLAAEGVTGGCGGGNYCPDQSVTRAQMAVFLLKTSQGSSYTPPAATGLFGDVPVGSFAADFIEDLYGRGITGGCSLSPLLYCPGNSVLRQQMATFLSRTFLP